MEVMPPAPTLVELYETMLRIRMFEESLTEPLTNHEIKCPVHLYTGQEAVAAGVCANLRNDDWVFSTHRSHGHYIAKGGDMSKLMAELYGKASGCSHGRGGSMHVACPEKGLPGSSAIVAGTIPNAVGAALAFSIRKEDRVAVAFFGDGAVCEGVLYEALNFASLRGLPVLFVCENNLYSTHMRISASIANTALYTKGEAFDIPSVRLDGNDVMAVYRSAAKAVADARAGGGPALLECMTYRWRGHVGPNYDVDKGLRSKEELDRWMEHCPVHTLEQRLLQEHVLTESECEKIRHKIEVEIKAAALFARESPYPEPDEVCSGVFGE
ncbi:MAG: thiamine pyrophosphate-dependent dehydrogenase E1 component subunit alpha [Methermicoccaceae archaeon]